MNEKVKQYIENKIEKNKQKIASSLIAEGVYNIVYAPLNIMGYGHMIDDNRTFKFPVKFQNAKIGDKIRVSNDGETIEVIIDKLEITEYGTSYEYPFSEYNSDLDHYRKYKKEPIELTDEEYEAVKQVSEINNVQQENNTVADILTAIAWITYIGGFFLGCFLGNIEVEGVYYSHSEFSFAVAIIYWCAALISGTIFLGFAEIIKLLTSIKNK